MRSGEFRVPLPLGGLRMPAHRGHLPGLLLAVGLLLSPEPGAWAQSGEPRSGTASPLDRLADQTLQNVMDRIERPLGHVIDRRRSRVFVAIAGEPPAPGTQLVAMRPVQASQPQPEELIAHLQVVRASPGVLECRESERTGRRHTEEGDIVRLQAEPKRILLTPCIPLFQLPTSIPQILAEKLRDGLRGHVLVQLVVDPLREARAAEAYRDGTLPSFLQEQPDLDEVFVPVLLLTPEKLVLNLESFSVSRRSAIDMRSAGVDLDGVLRSWIQAGAEAPNAPPGFRLLSSQLYPWRLAAMGRAGDSVIALTPDSMFVLAFESPGLRRLDALPLGPKAAVRRVPTMLILDAKILRLASPDLTGDSVSWILSEERWPRALLPGAPPHPVSLGEVGAGLEIKPALESIWRHSGGPETLASRWWPAPGRGERPVILPLFADLDGNGRIDLLWNDRLGSLCIMRSERGAIDFYPGFGDVKAVQPRSDPASRPVLWLTDAGCCGAADRLHAAQLDGTRLRLVWSSEHFEGSIIALVSDDFDGDGAFDLIVAEQVPAGTRLVLLMAIPGERTLTRGLAVSSTGAK